MKVIIAYATVVFWTTLLSAMQQQDNHLLTQLKLRTPERILGKIISNPERQAKVEYTLGNFVFTLMRNTTSDDPIGELSIRTHDEHKSVIASLAYPLIPHTTSSVTFSCNDVEYTASITSIQITQIH